VSVIVLIKAALYGCVSNCKQSEENFVREKFTPKKGEIVGKFRTLRNEEFSKSGKDIVTIMKRHT
jgi:hypothetical protein